MHQLIVTFVLAKAPGLFISRLFSNKRDDRDIVGEAINADGNRNKVNLLPILLFLLTLAGLVLFVLPRFGISVMRLVEKAIAFLYSQAALYSRHQGKLKYRSAYATFAII